MTFLRRARWYSADTRRLVKSKHVRLIDLYCGLFIVMNEESVVHDVAIKSRSVHNAIAA